MARDPEKARARKRRYLDRKKIEKYGATSIGVNMSGRHGNHARGPANARYNPGRLLTSHGYVAVRVPAEHPHAWGAGRQKYAYEHIVVVMARLGRPLREDETVHHRNHDRTDNRDGNLELLSRRDHAREHDAQRGRDELGRFPPADLRVREMPRIEGKGRTT